MLCQYKVPSGDDFSAVNGGAREGQYREHKEAWIETGLVIGIQNGPTSASRRTHPPSPAVVSPSPYALHINPESIWRWGDVRQGGPAVVDPELELLQGGCRWVHLRADYHTTTEFIAHLPHLAYDDDPDGQYGVMVCYGPAMAIALRDEARQTGESRFPSSQTRWLGQGYRRC